MRAQYRGSVRTIAWARNSLAVIIEGWAELARLLLGFSKLLILNGFHSRRMARRICSPMSRDWSFW
jgi:hypothetical protein